MAKPEKIDWEAIEMHYRAGIRSLKDIGHEFGVTDAGIIKHARNHKWSRDLTAKIQARAAQKVSEKMVSEEVSALTKIKEEDRIEVEAEIQARTLTNQRKDIKRAGELLMKLFAEVEAQTTEPELFSQLAELMTEQGEGAIDKLNEIYRKTISTPSRIDSMKKLMDAMKTLVALQRENLGIDKGINKSQSIGEFLESLQ